MEFSNLVPVAFQWKLFCLVRIELQFEGNFFSGAGRVAGCLQMEFSNLVPIAFWWKLFCHVRIGLQFDGTFCCWVRDDFKLNFKVQVGRVSTEIIL